MQYFSVSSGPKASGMANRSTRASELGGQSKRGSQAREGERRVTCPLLMEPDSATSNEARPWERD